MRIPGVPTGARTRRVVQHPQRDEQRRVVVDVLAALVVQRRQMAATVHLAGAVYLQERVTGVATILHPADQHRSDRQRHVPAFGRPKQPECLGGHGSLLHSGGMHAPCGTLPSHNTSTTWLLFVRSHIFLANISAEPGTSSDAVYRCFPDVQVSSALSNQKMYRLWGCKRKST